MVRRRGWTVGYVIANQIALFVVTVLAVRHRRAARSCTWPRTRSSSCPHGLFAVSLMTTFAPELASAARRGDIPALRAQLSRGLRLTTVVIVPAAALYIAPRAPADRDAAPTRRVLRARRVDRGRHARGVRGRAVALLDVPVRVARVHVAARHAHAVPINCIENVVNIALAFALYSWLGVPGLALAFSLAYFVAACVVARRRSTGGSTGIDGPALATTVGEEQSRAAAVAAGVSWLVADAIGWSATGEAPGVARARWPRRDRASTSGSRWLIRLEELQSARHAPPRAARRIASGDHPMGIRVVTDSACDLPAPLVEALGIEIVPLTIRFGDEEFVDRVELSADEFWRELERLRHAPRDRGAVARRVRGRASARLAARGADGIVCINLSSHLSGTMQSAQVAATGAVEATARCRSSTR